MTGARPGSLAVSGDDFRQALLWQDITFFRDTDGPGIYVVIHYKWLKGQRDRFAPGAASFAGARFLIKPCREANHLHVDAPTLLLLLALDRGLFGSLTIDELLNHRLAILPQDRRVTKQAVFLMLKGPNNADLNFSKPLRSIAFNATLQRASLLAGLNKRVSMYVFRREFITQVKRNVGSEAARALACHATPGDTISRYYDYGIGDLDMTGAVLGEGEHVSALAKERLLNRTMTSSAAIHSVGTISVDERKDFVSIHMIQDELMVGFESAHGTILANIRDKFRMQPDACLSLAATMRVLDQQILVKNEDESSASLPRPWSRPPSMDDVDPQQWITAGRDVVARGAKHTLAFLKDFILRRKTARNYTIHHLQKAFNDQWLKSAQEPTAAQAAQRCHESNLPPSTLNLQSGSKKSGAGRHASSSSDTTRVDNLPSAAEDRDIALMRQNEVANDDVMAVNFPRWTGQESNDAEADEDDEAGDELDANIFDPLDEVIRQAAGQPIPAVILAEQGEEEAASPGPGSEQQRREFYDMTKARLIEVWKSCLEIP